MKKRKLSVSLKFICATDSDWLATVPRGRHLWPQPQFFVSDMSSSPDPVPVPNPVLQNHGCCARTDGSRRHGRRHSARTLHGTWCDVRGWTLHGVLGVCVTLILTLLCGCTNTVKAGEDNVDSRDFRFTDYDGEWSRVLYPIVHGWEDLRIVWVIGWMAGLCVLGLVSGPSPLLPPRPPHFFAYLKTKV